MEETARLQELKIRCFEIASRLTSTDDYGKPIAMTHEKIITVAENIFKSVTN